MTKSTITRERLEQLADNNTICKVSWDERIELAQIALAAMDSESVAIIDQANLDYLRSGADADVWPPEREEMGDVLLYRHAQPAPVVPEEITIETATIIAYGLPTTNIGAIFKAGHDACRAAILQAGTPTNEGTRQVDDLTMWIKRLVRSLKNSNPDSKLPREAMDYLTAKGLISVGDILR